MKSNYLTIIAVLLASIMMLAACGAKSTQAEPSITGQTAQTTQQDNVEESKTADDAGESTESKQEDSNVVPKEMQGTWTLFISDGGDGTFADLPSDDNGEEISFFSLAEDGTLTINNVDYPLERQAIEQIHGEGVIVNSELLTYYYNNGKIAISFDDISGTPISIRSNGMVFNGSIISDNVSNADLSLDNWQDFFEVAVSYDIRTDSWNDVEYVDCCVYLVPKEGIHILAVSDGRIAYDYAGTECSVLRFNTETEEFSITPMTEGELTQYADYVAFASTQRSGENDFGETRHWPVWDYSEPSNYLTDSPEGWACNITIFVSEKGDFTVDGTTVISPVAAAFDVDITRIMGNVYYSED